MNDISLYANYPQGQSRSTGLYSKICADLLAKTDPRTGVEGDKDERVVCEVFLPIIEEAIWVEVVRCGQT
jgi:hypothetical protein